MTDLEQQIVDAVRRYEQSLPGRKVSCQLTYTGPYNVVNATKLSEDGTTFEPGFYKAYEEGVKGFDERGYRRAL